MSPFITGHVGRHRWGSVLGRYFINSKGVAITVHSNTPLHVSINAGRDNRLCLKVCHWLGIKELLNMTFSYHFFNMNIKFKTRSVLYKKYDTLNLKNILLNNFKVNTVISRPNRVKYIIVAVKLIFTLSIVSLYKSGTNSVVPYRFRRATMTLLTAVRLACLY